MYSGKLFGTGAENVFTDGERKKIGAVGKSPTSAPNLVKGCPVPFGRP